MTGDRGMKDALWGEDDAFDFDTVDILTICQLFTAIVRSDRFCEGALDSAFESGIVLKLLKSLQKQLT